MSIEAGPEYRINDAWGGVRHIRFSKVKNTWITPEYVVFEMEGDHVTINHDEYTRIKAVINHRPRPK